MVGRSCRRRAEQHPPRESSESLLSCPCSQSRGSPLDPSPPSAVSSPDSSRPRSSPAPSLAQTPEDVLVESRLPLHSVGASPTASAASATPRVSCSRAHHNLCLEKKLPPSHALCRQMLQRLARHSGIPRSKPKSGVDGSVPGGKGGGADWQEGPPGKLMNCGGGGSCGTCIVEILDGKELLSERMASENRYPKKKPESWRLTCQTIVGNKDNSGKVTAQRLSQWKNDGAVCISDVLKTCDSVPCTSCYCAFSCSVVTLVHSQVTNMTTTPSMHYTPL